MKNFLFDLYGTLIDIRTDEESDAFWEKIARLLCSSNAGDVRAAYSELCRREAEKLPAGGEIELLFVFEKLLAAFAGSACKYLGNAPAFARAFREASMQKIRLFDGVRELIRGIHVRGGHVYLLSNAQACFTRRELEIVGLSNSFDGILLSSEAGFKKPSPKFFGAAFGKFSLAPADCLYIGNDLRDDVGGAHAAGIPCAYIETEQSRRCEDPPVPDYAASTHAELAGLLYALLP